MAGSASYSNGVFTVNGGGADIWGGTDQFNYVSQPLTGNGSIVARVTAQGDTDRWAKSGVMIKQSTATGSNYAMLAVTPGNGITSSPTSTPARRAGARRSRSGSS